MHITHFPNGVGLMITTTGAEIKMSWKQLSDDIIIDGMYITPLLVSKGAEGFY